MEGRLRSGEGFFKAQKQPLKYWVVEDGLIVILLNVKKKKHKGFDEGLGRGGEGRGHSAQGGDVKTSPSGHSRGLGHVAGGQACQGHLHGGALPGTSFGRRCFGRA